MVRVGMAIILMAVLVGRASFATSEERAPPGHEHLFYLTDDGVIVLRLGVELDRQDCHEVWNRRVDAIFTEIDADGDGALSEIELRSPAAAIYSPAVQRSPVRFVRQEENWPAATMSREMFGEYLRGRGAGPLALPAPASSYTETPAAPSRSFSPTMFPLLDISGDGGLAAEELFAAPDRLRKLDQDDDETLSQAELLPRDLRFAMNAVQSPPVMSASGDRAIADLAVRLFKLGPRNLGLPTELLEPNDSDGNGEFDLRELAEFLRDPLPSIEILVRLGVKDADHPVIEIIRIADPRIEIVREGAQPLLARGANRLELAANPAFRIDLRSETQRFQAADVDNNGYLEPDEVARLPELANLFPALDRDSDGKVYLNELTALRMKQLEFSRARATISPSEHGRNLFPMLDLNQDGRLSRREFRRGDELIARCDRNNDKLLSETELPSHLVLTIGYGAIAGRPQGGTTIFRAGTPQVVDITFGPVWFQRMDRNSDGEVSRREFLGPPERFRALDANNDGAIEAHEASASPE